MLTRTRARHWAVLEQHDQSAYRKRVEATEFAEHGPRTMHYNCKPCRTGRRLRCVGTRARIDEIPRASSNSVT